MFVDTAPVMEKPLAAAAGIGWQGKHSNLSPPRATAHGCCSGVDLHRHWRCRSSTHRTSRPVRLVHPPASLPARPMRSPAARGARCAALPELLDDRARRAGPARVPHGNGQPHLRLRRLPGRLPVEQVRASRRRPTPHSCRAPSWRHRASPSCWRSTTRASASCSPARRSSGSGANRFVRNCLYAAGNSGDSALVPSGGGACSATMTRSSPKPPHGR